MRKKEPNGKRGKGEMRDRKGEMMEREVERK